MTRRSFFILDRSIWDHSSFRRQRFSDREAFIWLVSSAAYGRRRVSVGLREVDLERGQLAHSSRHLASLWQWPEATVRRFLQRLKRDAAIDIDADAGATRITICNYDKYQRVSVSRDASGDATSDAKVTQQRRKREDKEIKVDSSVTTSLRNKREALASKRSDRREVLAAFKGVLSDDHANAVVEHRIRLGKPLIPHAALLLARRFSQAPEPDAAADEMIERGWQAWKPDWGRNTQGPHWQAKRNSLVEGLEEIERMYSPNDLPTRIAN
jgi:hypothetical protein